VWNRSRWTAPVAPNGEITRWNAEREAYAEHPAIKEPDYIMETDPPPDAGASKR
jgi:hypothetical protein